MFDQMCTNEREGHRIRGKLDLVVDSASAMRPIVSRPSFSVTVYWIVVSISFVRDIFGKEDGRVIPSVECIM